MTASALVDTGVILALLDRDDEWHQACAEAFLSMRFPLMTEAVMTEVFHLTVRDFHSIEPAWQFFDFHSVTLAPLADSDLPPTHALMKQYRDRPMDFADATLVHIANRESIA